MDKDRGDMGTGSIDPARLDDLVARGRTGDLAALESLYGMFKGPVFGLVYRYDSAPGPPPRTCSRTSSSRSSAI